MILAASKDTTSFLLKLLLIFFLIFKNIKFFKKNYLIIRVSFLVLDKVANLKFSRLWYVIILILRKYF